MDKDMKTGLACCGLIIIIAIIAFAMFGGDKPVENKTVDLDGVKFEAPITNNNSTSFTKTPSGEINWAYEYYENNVSAYLETSMPTDVSTKQSYDELRGFNQMRPIGDRWFIVYADKQSDCEMVFNSAHMD